MGKGRDMARVADLQSGGSGLHADVLDDFRDQLMIVFLKRLVDKDGRFSVSVAEVDGTGGTLVSFSINDGAFNFVVSKKS
jgi:hypothetical protein